MTKCQTCGFPISQPAKEEKKTVEAAKVNKQGPFCDLCRHLEMALRYANHRGMHGVAEYIKRAQDWSTR